VASRCLMTNPLPPNQESADQALRLLLLAIAGPNYAGALKEGNVAQQIDRCLNWVKAEASEAASLVDSCVPHGKPMLAQAQKRLEVLESLKLLQRLAASHFAES
jgi:hypothetical protein